MDGRRANTQRAPIPQAFIALAMFGLLLVTPVSNAQVAGDSQLVNWSCTTSPCPWGNSLDGQALVWPSEMTPVSGRLGYTVSHGIYLPAETAMGLTLRITAGTATLYFGAPDAVSHQGLVTITVGETYQVSGLAPGDVLSVQASGGFGYEIADSAPPVDPPADSPADPGPDPAMSSLVTWSCTGSLCPWGATASGHALVWPSVADPLDTRLGYTVSQSIYLPAASANGAIIWITSGTATLYAGLPDASSHRALVTVPVGEFHEVTGLAPGEVLSVQSGTSFGFAIALADPDETPPTDPPADPEPAVPESVLATWTCTGSPCPWGQSLSGYAAAWPADALPVSDRLGYTVSAAVYLPAPAANGMTVSMSSGTATLYAGAPNASSHRPLATITTGESFAVTGLAVGEGLSLQSDNFFTYEAAPTPPGQEPPPDVEPPVPDGVIYSIDAYWYCNTADCVGDPWRGGVVSWPDWSAYESNSRSGNNSRTVYSEAGALLYPYMGAWADGCEVTSVSGNVLIIEWERGTDVWRETLLSPGETYVIDLVGPEDGAMIETNDVPGNFAVTLNNCTPQPLP